MKNRQHEDPNHLTRRELVLRGIASATGAAGFSSPTCHTVFADKTTAHQRKAETLRILTYNIHMWLLGVDDLAKVIRQSNADIIGLNEAWDQNRNDSIAKKLGYNVVYGGQNPTKKHPRKAHTVNGYYMPQVLLTKHKIVSAQVFNAMAAKQHEDFDPEVPIYRGGTLAVLETTKETRFVVFVLHLHPWGDGANTKMTNMRL